MRISSALVAMLVLAACSSGNQPAAKTAFDNAVTAANDSAADDGRIVCAPAGNGALSRQCTLDRTQSAEGLILTVHKPDGGFRRFLVKPGYGVVAADGAEKATVTIVGKDEIEVAIGGDRFRLPATVKGETAKPAK